MGKEKDGVKDAHGRKTWYDNIKIGDDEWQRQAWDVRWSTCPMLVNMEKLHEMLVQYCGQENEA